MKCGVNLVALPGLTAWRVTLGYGRYEAKYRLALTKPTPNDALQFEDMNISLEFRHSKTAMEFALTNKTTSAIRIDWNQAAFVDWSENRTQFSIKE